MKTLKFLSKFVVIFYLILLSNEVLTQKIKLCTPKKKNYKVENTKLSIIYHPNYNESFGIFLDLIASWVHPFNGKKYEKIYNYLRNVIGINQNQFYVPEKIVENDLLLVHNLDYLDSLKSSVNISRAIDLEEAL